LFALDFRHLAERVSFARYAKQQHAERDSSYAVTEEKSHNALAQLSASGVTRKAKAQAVEAVFAAANAGQFEQAPFTKD
jgi:hypothetical protein